MVQIPRLREWREARALTQVELAELAAVSSRSVAGYEAGAGARPPTVRRLAKALGVEVADLRGDPDFPKEHSPFSAERALTLADSDAFRREAKAASVEELQQASLELARFTKPQTRENPSAREETHRRVIAHERIGIIEGELEERGAPSPVTLVIKQFNDAMTPPEETPEQSHEGQESQETA